MSSPPVVSVVLNSYNQARYLAQAVESVLDQTLGDVELIAIDNGSTDSSPAVLRRYQGHPRVRLLLEPDNAAVTRRFNQGVAAARGEFVSFLYSDDYYLAHKLERQVAAFSGLPADYGVVYGPGLGLNEVTGRTWRYPSVAASGFVLDDLLRRWTRGQLDMISPLVRRECLERYPFHEDVFAEGEGVFLRIAMTYRFHYLDEPGAVLRDHGANAGKALKRNFQITMATLERLQRHPSFPADQRPALRCFRRRLLRAYGWQAVRVGGDPAWARRCFREAVRVAPLEALHPKTVVGLALSLLPEALRARVNAAGTAVRRSPANPVYVEDYEGAVF